ncbi:UNKNOWN [Stylonychia lemnae]|uniref:Uncharacterized protein n=1 Tax=Stylonychia lemnae TaxID=5949 RepID=A0A078B1J0_STYLE|nr:UNKNOWN [Stylonychia lemnae]|eukprot:CDW88430.1 UNKNOWN [Stylonychia lemnae]
MNHIVQTSVLLTSFLTQLMEQLPQLEEKIVLKNPSFLEQDDLTGSTDEASWPKVKVPYNSEIKSAVYIYDWEEKKLETLRDMTIQKWVDSDGNRALSMVTLNVPLQGEMTCSSYFDFNARKLVKSVEGKDYCEVIDLKEDFVLREHIDALKNPDGGITTYLGTKHCRWTQETYHAFRIEVDNFDLKRVFILYFDETAKDLKWLAMIRPLPLIFEIENGLSERKFSDKDFEKVVTECPRGSKMDDESIHELFGMI